MQKRPWKSINDWKEQVINDNRGAIVIETSPLTFKLLFIKKIQEENSNIIIIFKNEQKVSLSKDNKNYDYYMRFVQRSIEYTKPIGVSIDNLGNIAEIIRADNDIVAQLAENRDKTKLKIFFRGHDGVFFLDFNHPKFQHIREILIQSLRENKRIWFIAKKPLLNLEEAIIME